MCDTYDITYSDLNPTLYFAGKRTVTESNFSHTHDAPELFIVLSGDLAIWMDGTTTPLTAGDIVCVPSHVHCRQCMIILQFYSLLHFQTFTLREWNQTVLIFLVAHLCFTRTVLSVRISQICVFV